VAVNGESGERHPGLELLGETCDSPFRRAENRRVLHLASAFKGDLHAGLKSRAGSQHVGR